MEAGRPRSKRGVSRQIAPKVTTLFSLSVSNTIWHVSQTVVRFTGTYAISAVALMAKFQLREMTH